MILFFRNNSHNAYGNLTKQLIFTPNTPFFTNLMNKATDQLNTLNKLERPIGVSDANELQETLAKNFLIAGIEFHHPSVRIIRFLYRLMLEQKHFIGIC